MANEFAPLYDEILSALVNGPLLHADESQVHLLKEHGYVWVFTSLDKCYFFYRSNREGAFLAEMLKEFRGVLVSDFYSAYESLPCPQQKCLLHFVRDIDNDLLANPFDQELKAMAQEFGGLMRNVIESVDKYGLKKRYLRKHTREAIKFLRSVSRQEYSSRLARSYQARFAKSGTQMFTFLDHDAVPWNNNYAEHAIKRFAKYRRNFDGYFTAKSLQDYLVLASVFVTCEYNNVNVLDFLLSREKTLSGLLRLSRKKRRHKSTGTDLPEDVKLSPFDSHG
jgi:hypothetical protein